jgi:hypothetical protein
MAINSAFLNIDSSLVRLAAAPVDDTPAVDDVKPGFLDSTGRVGRIGR